MPLQFNAPKMAGNCVQYSPFIDNRLLLGAAANFGIVGNGKAFALEIANTGAVAPVAMYDTQDSIFCGCWSEIHENQMLVGCGDGSLQLFDCMRPQFPLAVFKEHQREAFGVSWNLVSKHKFASCSWDGTIKLWDSGVPTPRSTATFICPPAPQNPNTIVYQVKYAPRNDAQLATACANGLVCVYDERSGNQAPVQQFVSPAGSGECLTVDWNKYRPTTLASGGSDGTIRIWDLRGGPTTPINELRGHSLAVKNVKWSPHSPLHLLSASYDMTAKVWLDEPTARVVPGIQPKGLLNDFKLHTEFVTDCDWSLWGEPGWVATTSWDGNVFIWKA